MTAVAIVGTGPIGRATAACLAARGHRATLWSPTGNGLLRLRGGGRGVVLRATGALAGEFEVETLSDVSDLRDWEVVLLAVPASAYPVTLPAIAPHLQAGQTVIASGALSLMPWWLRERGGGAGRRPLVVSWGTTLATARLASGSDVEVNTLRARFEVAALPSSAGAAALATCTSLFGDRFRLVDHALATVLSNLNPVAHAGEVIPNLSRVERGETWPLFELFTPAGCAIGEAIDAERLAIASGFGLRVRTLREHWRLSYHVPEGPIAEMAAAIHRTSGSPPGPRSLEHRYLAEDVPYGLCFYERMAGVAGVATPVLTACITLLSTATGRDYRSEDWVLRELSLDGITAERLLARCQDDA